MTGVPQFERLVVFKTRGEPTRNAKWEPVRQEDLPAWVKDPDIVARMVAGWIVSKPGAIIVDAKDEEWFMAQRAEAMMDEARAAAERGRVH